MYAFGVFCYVAISLQSQAKADTNHIVISQIQLSGTGNANDEFVELYNPTEATIDLSGWRLSRKTSSAGATPQNLVASLSGMIAPRSYYLIAHPASSFTLFADRLYSSSSSAITTNNTISLFSDAGQTIVDKVGIGTAADVEGTAFGTNPGNNQSLMRKATANSTESTLIFGGTEATLGNGYDTDTNASDFVLINTAMPRNTKSPQAQPSVTETPIPTPTQIPTQTPAPAENPTATPTAIPTVTLTPTVTSHPTVTSTPVPTPTSTPIPTSTPVPTNTPTPFPTATPIPTATPTPMPTNTPTPTMHPTSTPVLTTTPFPTATPTVQPTPTTIPTATPTQIPLPTVTPIPTPTPSPMGQVIVDRSITPSISLVCVRTTRQITILRFVFSIPEITCSLQKH